MYVTFFLWSSPCGNVASSTFYLPLYFSMHYFKDVPLAMCVYILYLYNLSFSNLLYQYEFRLSQLLPFYIFMQCILKRSKGVTSESRQHVTTLDRRAIFFFVRTRRHVLRTSVIRHQGGHVSELWLVVINARWLNLSFFNAWMHSA